MDNVSLLLIIIGITVDALFILNDNKYHNGLSVILKTLASLCFLLLAIHNYKGNGLLIVIALGLDVLGDFVLILRNITNKHKDLIFVLGTISFLIAHILFSIYLIKLNIEALYLGILFNLILFTIFAIAYLKRLNISLKMKMLGTTYVFIIMFTSGLSISNFIYSPSFSNLIFMIACIIFVSSDLVLIIHKFKKSLNILQITYRVLYYISQLLLAVYVGLIV